MWVECRVELFSRVYIVWEESFTGVQGRALNRNAVRLQHAVPPCHAERDQHSVTHVRKHDFHSLNFFLNRGQILFAERFRVS